MLFMALIFMNLIHIKYGCNLSDSGVIFHTAGTVKRKALLSACCPQSMPSFLPPSSSHNGVRGICSNSTVVVPVFGHLYVALHAPLFTPAGRRAGAPFSRKNTAQQVHYNILSSQKPPLIRRFRKDSFPGYQ